jgi:EpsD family peptidyl-prolyl cis-trans isomerase
MMRAMETESRGKRGQRATYFRGALLAVALSALLVACGDKKGGSGDAPTGQVVARLDGTDITILEVNAELAGVQLPPNVSRREAEQAALQNIITRRMLMKAAEERKLNETPQFKLQERRAGEQLLVQALARDIAAKVPQPTREDADKFIAENPGLFAERRILVVDQLQFPRTPELEKLPLAEVKTMEGVEEVLRGASIPFRRQPGNIDLLGANPQFVKEINKVLAANPQEIFMFPAPAGSGQVMLVNQVRESRLDPFVGERARTFAQNYLRQLRVQEALAKELKARQEAAKALVSYQDGYAPPADKKANAAAAGLKDPIQGATEAAPSAANAGVPGAPPAVSPDPAEVAKAAADASN